MATKTLGIKFEIAGVKEAQAGLDNLRKNLNASIIENKTAVKENLSILRSDSKRAEAVEKTNQRIFFSYLGLRADVRRETNSMVAETQATLKKQQRAISESVNDYFTGIFGSKTQKQNLVIKQERKDFRERSTYKGLDKNSRNTVLEQRLILKEFVLDLKKIIKEDLKETLSETFSQISEKESSFSKISKVATTPFKAAAAGIMSPIQAVIFGGLQKIGEDQVTDFAQGVSSQMQKSLGLQLKEVGQDVGGAIGGSMYLAYEKIMIATRNSVIDRHPVSGSNETLHITKLLDDFGQILQGFVLSLGAIPIKAKKRIDMDKKAIPLVKEKAGELMINRKLTEAQEAEIAQSKSITVLTGGANYDEQAGTTDFAYRTLQPMLRGSYVHPVKNLFSNAQGTAEFDRVFGQMLSMGLSNDTAKAELLQFAKNNMDSMGEDPEGALTDEELENLFAGDAAEVSEKITDFFKKIHIPLPKILEVVFKGYNPDDIAMAAEGIFFKEKYPELPLQFMGTSFGGFNAAGAAELMNRMGYDDVKAVGVTTPLIGMESTVDPDNYMSSIGDLDFLYEMTLGSVFEGKVPKPDNLQVVPGKGKGHLLGHFLAQSPEFRNALQHFLKGRVDVPSMEEYSGKEVMAMGRIPGNNAESAIVRTIKKNLGEKHDDGYTFNQEDLIGHRDHLVRMAGGADLKKIKNPQLKEFYSDYIKFLDTLAEELETVEKFKQVGKKFKPINSLRQAANFYPDLGHLIPNHPDFEMTESEFTATNQEVEANKNLVAFKRKIDNESPNIERTYRAMLGEDITEQGYGYYDEEDYQARANEHLGGLIGYLEDDVLRDANDSEKQAAAPYLELLKKLQQTILQVGDTGELSTSEIAEAEKLLGISLKEYKSVLSKNETLNVKDRKGEISAAAAKAKKAKGKNLVMDVKPELQAYIWAINQELIREGKEQIDVATAEYLGSGYKNHAIKANGKVYKFARHTNPLAAKVNKMMGKKKESYQGEIAALKKLQGQNAPNFIAGGEEFMAMEEAEGVTLKEALETASPEERRDLLEKSAKLLKSFHQKGVAHFDFHPGNIIKQNDGNLVAIDWEAAEVTKDKQQHYYDREVAVSRFQDVLSGSMGVETSADVASMFDDAYYGNESSVRIRDAAKTDNQGIIKAYNKQLNKIIENATEKAIEAIRSDSIDINGNTAYQAIRDRMAEYRKAVSDGSFETARRIGELLLESSEFLKQIFDESGDTRKGQLTRIQNEILSGDRGAGRSPTPLAEVFSQTDAVQLDLDLWNDTADGARESLNSETGAEVGSEFAEGIIDGAEDELDINSPSRVFNWIGEMVKAGFVGGVEGLTEFLSDSMSGVVDSALEVTEELVNNVSDAAAELNGASPIDTLFETEGVGGEINDFFGNLVQQAGEAFENIVDRFPILGKIKDFLFEIGGEVLQLIGVFSFGEALLGFGGEALEVAKEMESLERSIVSVSAGAIEGAKNISFARQEAARLSIDLVTAQESYKRILGATRDTPLEGFQTRNVFSTLSTTARNRGLNTDATNRLFLGFEQAIAKLEFKSEEVKGQISEVIGDIQNLLSRSVGVPSNMLNALMEAGDLKVVDVMPRLLAQFNAQNAALGNTSQTAQAAQTKLNNAILEFKDSIGRKLQPAQKLGLNALADILDVLRDESELLIKLVSSLMTTVLLNLTLKLVATKLAMQGLRVALFKLVGLLSSAPFLAFAGKFLLISAAIEIWTNNIKLASNAFPELQDRIEGSTRRLDALRKAFDDAGDAANNSSSNFGQLQLNEGAEVGDNKFLRFVAGGDRWNLDNLVRNRIQKGEDWLTNTSTSLYEKIGLNDYANKVRQRANSARTVTQAQRKQNDFVVGASDLVQNSDRTLTYGNDAKGVIGDIQELDGLARELQSKRLDILPGDSEALEKALAAEKEVYKERDKLLEKTAQYQQSLQGDIQDIKDTLVELNDLDQTGGTREEQQQRANNRASLEQRLDLLEDEKQAIDEINARIPKFLTEVDRLVRNSDERVRGFIGNQDDDAVKGRNETIKDALVRGLSEADLELKLDNLTGNDLENRINFINQEIKSLEDKLESGYLTEGVQGLERSAASQGLELTPETLERMLSEGRSSQETKAANLLLALDEYEGLVAQSESDLLELLKNNKSKLKDYNKTISDFFFNINQKIKEAQLEIERTLKTILQTKIKNKLNSVLSPNADSFVNGLISTTQSMLDEIYSYAEKVMGQKGARIGFEGEKRGLEYELEEFARNVRTAGDALVEFTNKITGKPSNTGNDKPMGSAGILPVPSAPPVKSNKKLPAPPSTPNVPSGRYVSRRPRTEDKPVVGRYVSRRPIAKDDQPIAGRYVSRRPIAKDDQPIAGRYVSRRPIAKDDQPIAGRYVSRRPIAKDEITEQSPLPTSQLPLPTTPRQTVIPFASDVAPQNDLIHKAKQLTEQLISLESQNLNKQDYLVGDLEKESLNISLDNTIESERRKVLQEIKDRQYQAVESVYSQLDLVAQYDFESAKSTGQQAIRSLNQTFSDRFRELFNSLQFYRDEIDTSKKVIAEAPGLLEQAETSEEKQAIQFAVDNAKLLKAQYQANLTTTAAQGKELVGASAKATEFVTEQNKLKEHQEKLNKRSLLLNQKATIAEQRGTLEAQRKVKAHQEDLRLYLRINELRQQYKPGEFLDEAIRQEEYQSEINQSKNRSDSQISELDLEKRLLDLQTDIDNKKAGLLSRFGVNFGAEKVKRDNAIAQENLRFERELIELRKQYKDQPELLEDFARAATELNSVNLSSIKNEFKTLGKTVEDAFVSSAQGFFTNINTQLFDGQEQRERQILEERLRYAEELNGLENQYREEPGKLAHLKNRARELNEQKLDKINNEFNVFKKGVDLAKQALLEFVKQLAAAIAQAAAAKIIGTIIGGLAGGIGGGGVSAVGNDFGGGAAGVAAFTADEGMSVGEDVQNFNSGGDIKSRKVNNKLTNYLRKNAPGVKKAFRSEGEGARLGVFHTGEELLSRKTGEAPVYQMLKARLGFNPLQQLIPYFADGGTFDAEANILSGFKSSRPRIDLSVLDNAGRNNNAKSIKNITLQTTVITPDADSFRLNEDQRNQDLLERLRRGI